MDLIIPCFVKNCNYKFLKFFFSPTLSFLPETEYTGKNNRLREFAVKHLPVMPEWRVPMKDENCIFCKLASGEIPSTTLYEDEDFRVFLDIAPAVRGHAIVVPKQHMADLLTVSCDTSEKILPIVSKTARAMKDALGCDGINILQNNGEAAWQSIFHLHFHVLPRYKDDNFTIPWKTLTYNSGEAEEIAAKIRGHFSDN